MWPVEAEEVSDLTELRNVGPYVAGVIRGLLDDPPEPVDPPPIREGFITLSHAREVLAEHPNLRAAVRADLQMHTTYSDGATSIEEMARASAALGHEYIAITDHSKGLPIAGGIDDHLSRQDLNIELLRLAARAGCMISIGTDAHHPDELAVIDIGIAAAIEADVPFDRILNTMEPDWLVDWARAARG